MNNINEIKDKKTREFSEACFNQNSIDELWEATQPDTTDMKIWGITEAQWKEAITAALVDKLADDDNVSLLFTLNESGQNELLAAIAEVSNDTLTNPSAYFEDAENDTARWCNGESASIEISGQFTQSGKPEVILLKKEWFDSEIVDQE